MLVNCPHCNKQLKLGDKAVENLKKLPEGRSLKVQCVQCKQPFTLSGTTGGTAAVAGDQVSFSKEETEIKMKIKPPKPPGLADLLGKEINAQKAIDGIPRVLLVFPDREDRSVVFDVIEGIGYQIEEPEGVKDAIERLFSTEFALVIHHVDYEKVPLAESKLHEYICQLPMSKRRDIFYVLIGKEMQTFYNMQALAYSANLVVNDTELPHISTLLKKAIPEYEELFGAYMEELRVAGK